MQSCLTMTEPVFPRCLMTSNPPFLWSPVLSCTEAPLPCTSPSSHTGQPGYWGWQRPDRNTNTFIISKHFFLTWPSASTIFDHVQSVHPQESTLAAWKHWSGEEDVQKEEVIVVGCHLIPIMYVESPTCALRRKDRWLQVNSNLWFRQVLMVMWMGWEDRRAERWAHSESQ